MNALENYNIASHQLNSKIKTILKEKDGLIVEVKGFIADEESVVASIYYYDSANQFISKDIELRIEEFDA